MKLTAKDHARITLACECNPSEPARDRCTRTMIRCNAALAAWCAVRDAKAAPEPSPVVAPAGG